MGYTTKLAAALDHARNGYAVFPLIPNEKKPAIKNWQNLATTNEAQIESWWQAQPNANIGITTGSLLVVDIDPRNGGGIEFAALSQYEDFPKTVSTRTQGGGAHVIYALPPHTIIGGGANKLAPGVDIKSYGGFICAPGSTIDGRPYEWSAGHFDGRKPALAPEWLIERCKAPKAKTETAGERVVVEDDTATTLARDWLVQSSPLAVLGELNDTAFKVAARLFDYGLEKPSVLELMRWWGEHKCTPAWDDRLATATLDHIATGAATYRSNAIGARHPDASGFEPVEIAPRVIETASIAQPKAEKFYAIRADEGARQALQDPAQPLIDGLYYEESMGVLIGKPGGGKTFMCLDKAYHVAKGVPWHGRAVKQGAVVYLAAEAGRMILRRLAALEAHYGPLNDTPLFVIPCPADFAHGTGDADAVIALIRNVEQRCGQKVRWLIVDTLSRVVAGGDENSSKDMGAAIATIDRIRHAVKCAALIVHHPGKDEAKGSRGWSGVLGATDSELTISNHTLNNTKQRDTEEFQPIKFKLKPILLGNDPNGKAITSCFVEIVAPGGPDEPLDVSPILAEMSEMIEAGLKDAHPKDSVYERKFGVDFVVLCYEKGDPSSVPPRTTITTRLTALTESGWLKKGLRGQWLIKRRNMTENDGTPSGERMTDEDGAISPSSVIQPTSSVTGLLE